MTDWLQAIAPTIRASTHDSYSRNIRNHIVAYIGGLRLTKVDAGVLNSLYALLLGSGRRPPSRIGKGYSGKVLDRALRLRSDGCTLKETAERLRLELPEAEHITKDTLASLLRRAEAKTKSPARRAGLDPRMVNYVHTILHRAFKDAVRWGRLARNTADAADPPRAGQKADGVHTWDAGTLRRFLDASRAADDRLQGLWVLFATTGMRRGEAVGLRWSDVDLDGGRLRVVQTITQTSSVVRIGEPKTSRGRRSIALDAGTVTMLREHRRRMLQERLLVGADFDDHGLVFHQPDGACLRPDAVSNAFLSRIDRYGLPTDVARATAHVGDARARARHPSARRAGTAR